MNIDFAFVLVLLSGLSGLIWLCDALIRARRRRAGGPAFKSGAPVEEGKTPLIVEYARSLFPIFLVVLVLRSFLVEPFRIPSGSMMPTLLIGDFILVNKYNYGLRLPVLNTKVMVLGAPKRGDVVVFRYPEDPSTPYIKRVVGLPGDRIGYYGKALWINGVRVGQTPMGEYLGVGAGEAMTGAEVRDEALDGVEHPILIERGHPSIEVETLVPQGHYFVMGDNRDNSKDSRYWGTVPDDNLIGRAFMIWMNWDSSNGGIGWRRLGRFIE
jgi:signal peptidase I